MLLMVARWYRVFMETNDQGLKIQRFEPLSPDELGTSIDPYLAGYSRFPSYGCSNPESILRVVVLPAPFGRRKPAISPAAPSKETPTPVRITRYLRLPRRPARGPGKPWSGHRRRSRLSGQAPQHDFHLIQIGRVRSQCRQRIQRLLPIQRVDLTHQICGQRSEARSQHR
jgi:hypothetical protein